MHAAIVARHALSTELSRGIAERRDRRLLPAADRRSRRAAIYGVEALARWRHPTRGLVGPDDFIPLAEESGAILALGRAVLFEACREAAAWRTTHGEPLTVTVNLAAAQLGHDDFVRGRGRHPAGHGPARVAARPRDDRDGHVPRHRNDHRAARRPARPRACGSPSTTSGRATRRSATCAASRSTSSRSPASSSRPPGPAPDEWAFANAIVAPRPDPRTCGSSPRGSRSRAQLDRLRELGCELGQGFLFARPMPGEDDRGGVGAPARSPGDPLRASRPSPAARSPRSGLMFILYAVVAGPRRRLPHGRALDRPRDASGSAGPAADRRSGSSLQVVLFAGPVADRRRGPRARACTCGSTLLVVAAVAAQRRIPGMPIVARRGGLQPRRDRRQRRLHAGRGRRPSPRSAGR